MSLVIVRSSALAISKFVRSPLGRAAIVLVLEIFHSRLQDLKHPAGKLAARVVHALMAIETIVGMRAWLTDELPRLNRELARLGVHYDESKLVQSILATVINAVNRPIGL